MFACIYWPKILDGVSLADFAYGFSPLVEETKSDTIVIDVEGCELLFGSPYGLANEISLRATKSIPAGGLESKVNVALAANPDAAIHAASNLKGVSFVSQGEELVCLGDFPLELLQYSLVNIEPKRAEELFETLRLWGIDTFRDFAILPVAGVSERLGQDGLCLQRLAAGKTDRQLKLKQPPPVFASAIELEHHIAELEPLSFIFARLLNQLCASLNAYGLATNELLIQMQLANKALHERKLVLPYPMRDHKVFLKLLLLDTEMHPPQAAVTSVAITCEPVKPRVLQNGLFTPLAPAPDKLELTLARLAKLVGEENVGSPMLLGTHRPDAFTLKRFVLSTKSDTRRSRKAVKSQPSIPDQQALGFRMYRPPLRAIVEVEQGCPRQISAWSKGRSVYGKIIYSAGPWRTTGDWWSDDRWSRDEWDVALDNGGRGNNSKGLNQSLYRIYRELSSHTWFVEGSYD
jgi:protein ImuB